MDDISVLSNMDGKELFNTILSWATSLKNYMDAILNYMNELDTQKTKWASIRTSINNAEQLLDTLKTFSASTEPSILMNISDIAVDASHMLNIAASTLLNYNTIINYGMSHTYSENLKILKRNIQDTESATKLIYKKVIDIAGAVGFKLSENIDIKTITKIYNEKLDGRSSISAELYVNTLIGRIKYEPNTSTLETAKDLAFGLPLDNIQNATIDASTLSEYHLLQTMTFTPLNFLTIPETSTPVYDISLPNTKIAVTYNILPLIDRKHALTYGPIANMKSGLNYKLIERLQTIYTKPYKASSEKVPRLFAPITGPLIVTTDGTTQLQVLKDKTWAPFAGSRSRVEAYSNAQSVIILDGIKNDNWRDTTIREQYETAVKNKTLPSGECNTTNLLQILITIFERIYDETLPKTLQEFQNIVLPEHTPADYFCEAISFISFGTIDERIREMQIKTNSPKVPYETIRKELNVTHMVQTISAGQKLSKQFAAFYYCEKDVFKLSNNQLKIALMKHFKEIAQKALKEEPIECLPTTLKIYTLLK